MHGDGVHENKDGLFYGFFIQQVKYIWGYYAKGGEECYCSKKVKERGKKEGFQNLDMSRLFYTIMLGCF